jgi:hypothetical protein
MLTTEKSAAKPAATGNPRAHWPAELQKDYEANQFSGCVGSILVSETDRVRVWHLTIPAGRRCNFHKGETRHLNFGKGEYMVHAVENIGKTDLLFTTVEFLDSPNQPLPIPDAMRLKYPA